MKQSKRMTKLLAFLPAALVIGVTAIVASGMSVVSGATAASTVGVTGNVSSSFSTSPGVTGGGGLTGCSDETLGTFSNGFAPSNGCTITFSSNNVNGADVVFSNDTTGVGQSEAFFCSDGVDGVGGTRSCATDLGRLDDAVGIGQTILNGSDRFGLALMSLSGDGTPTQGTGVSAVDADPLSTDAVWSGIPVTASPIQLCRSTGPNTTSTDCQFKFGGSGELSQGAGDYTGTLRLTAGLL